MTSTMRFDRWEDTLNTIAVPISSVNLLAVIPTSVDKSGGTASISSTGKVTFSSTAYISLNGIFTSKYKNYKIVLSNIVDSSDITAKMRFRSTGVDNTTGNYFYNSLGYANATQFNLTASNTDHLEFSVWSAHASGGSAELLITNPYTSLSKQMIGSSRGSYATNTTHAVGGAFNGSALFDGITIYSGTNISGEISVYGFNS